MIKLRKISGIDGLLGYLEETGYPMTEEQVNGLLADKQLPHVRYGQVYLFYADHVDWWVRQQTRKDRPT